jgi:hypothetical protein
MGHRCCRAPRSTVAYYDWGRACALAIAGVLILLAYWFRPDVVPGYVGKIDVVVDTNRSFVDRQMEIGDSNVIFNFRGHGAEQGVIVFRIMDLKLEDIGGKIGVSTKIKDQQGKMVAELIRNEWNSTNMGPQLQHKYARG